MNNTKKFQRGKRFCKILTPFEQQIGETLWVGGKNFICLLLMGKPNASVEY